MEIIQLIGLAILAVALGIGGIFIASEKYKAPLAVSVVVINALLTSIPAVNALTGEVVTGFFSIPHLSKTIDLKIDSLSAWFVLIINFTTINGALAGSGYLKYYRHLKTNTELHWVFYILFHISMIWVCVFENGFAFIISWEFMSLSSLMLVIFEYQSKNILKAGLNYMVQMRLSVAFLTLGFILLYISTGSINFSSLSVLPATVNSLWIFIMLFTGFAIKAGFIPFHTWLPHADPAAPSHVSGVMSGVVVKLGIYGMLRIISHFRHDWLIFGEVILSLSVVTAIYGIANAALKYDFKQMLAFCTIENIGIIGMGIGLGLIGMGAGHPVLTVLGFSSALLHTLNHSLFKSLLFFSSESVYQQTCTRNVEKLGGLAKKMPVTAMFFLVGSIAIGGLPPFNGFISEYIVYSGLFKGLIHVNNTPQVILFVLSIAGLVFVGGASILTFTKTYGVIFLGRPRSELHHEPAETSFITHLPQYLIVLAMLSVAFVPQFFFRGTLKVVSSLFPADTTAVSESLVQISGSMATVGLISFLFFTLLFLLFGLRRIALRNRIATVYETWSCGYTGPVAKVQYTARSFAKPFGALFGFLVKEQKNYKEIQGKELYPGYRTFSTWYPDLLEKYVIAPLAKRIIFVLNYFQFIQNGYIRWYVIYGLFFILLIFLGSVLKIIS